MANSLPDAALTRLNALAKSHGSQRKLAGDAGMSPASLNQMLAGKSEPSASRLASVCAALGVSLDYVMTGKGSAPGGHGLFSVPFHDITVSAGDGAEIIESGAVDEYVQFPEQWLRENFGQLKELRIVKVGGDSMRPTMFDGDLVMININRTQESDGIFVLRYDGDLYVKRVFFEKNRVRLVSDNVGHVGYNLYRNKEADMELLHLIGRVVWTGRAM